MCAFPAKVNQGAGPSFSALRLQTGVFLVPGVGLFFCFCFCFLAFGGCLLVISLFWPPRLVLEELSVFLSAGRP